MPAAIASRARASTKNARASRDTLPPAKKTKLSQPSPSSASRQNGLSALLNSTTNKKPSVSAKLNGLKNARKQIVDEATAEVGGGLAGNGDVDMEDVNGEVIEISSAEEESGDSSSEEDDEGQDDEEVAADEKIADGSTPVANGHVDEDDRPVEDGELSFGERLQAQEPEPMRETKVVDVETAFAGPDMESRALAAASTTRPLSAPSALSLGTNLTQALRTNDQEMLESCFKVIDVDIIYATVERLPSPLVGNLLQRLAERLYKKPGRAGMLMVWVQWSLAAHGGYLASQPQLVKQLATLNKVLKERASGLQPLLSLKGRLDMLQAQLELRRRNQRRAINDDEDEALIYVEGQDDISSEDEESNEDGDAAPGSSRKRIRQDSNEDDNSSVDAMPTTMEMDEDSEGGSEDSEDMLDDEAEETDNDTGDDMSEPQSEDDFVVADDMSESEEEAKPPRRSTAGRAGLSRRY